MTPYEVQRGDRRCAATDKPIGPGEEYYSVLRPVAGSVTGEVQRFDYTLDAWQDPGEGAIGWWRRRAPESDAAKPKLAPTEVLLGLFDQWEELPERRDARYVLALLLVRRRVFRIATPGANLGDTEDEPTDDIELLRVDCPKRNESYEVPVTPPGPDRAATIQAELNQLLHSDGS